MALIEDNNLDGPVTLRLRVEGPAFEPGIPVHLLATIFSEFQGILDKAYLGLSGKPRLKGQDRRRFYVLTSGVKRGSLEADLELVLAGAVATLPFIFAPGPKAIWQCAKQAFEFLVRVCSALRLGQRPTYSWSADRSKVSVNIGTINVVYNGPVFDIAEASFPNYRTLTKPIRQGLIREYALGDGDQGAIRLGHQEADLFSTATKIDETPISFRAEIFEFNKFVNAGKLHVPPGETVPEGDYKFKVIGDQHPSECIEAMLHQEVRVECLKEISLDPFSEERIIRFGLISVKR